MSNNRRMGCLVQLACSCRLFAYISDYRNWVWAMREPNATEDNAQPRSSHREIARTNQVLCSHLIHVVVCVDKRPSETILSAPSSAVRWWWSMTWSKHNKRGPSDTIHHYQIIVAAEKGLEWLVYRVSTSADCGRSCP